MLENAIQKILKYFSKKEEKEEKEEYQLNEWAMNKAKEYDILSLRGALSNLELIALICEIDLIREKYKLMKDQ